MKKSVAFVWLCLVISETLNYIQWTQNSVSAANNQDLGGLVVVEAREKAAPDEEKEDDPILYDDEPYIKDPRTSAPPLGRCVGRPSCEAFGWRAHVEKARKATGRFHGKEFAAYVHDRDLIGSILLNEHAWEEKATERMYSTVSTPHPATGGQKIFVDIGANIGWHSLAIGSTGVADVVSIEAMPHTAALFRRSIEENAFRDKILLVETAVSTKESPSELCFTIDVNNHGGASASRPSWHKDFPCTPVKATTVDEALANANVDMSRIYSIKLDVEGFEWNALQGATRMLEQRPCHIFLEFHAKLLKAAAVETGTGTETHWQHITFLDSLGYTQIKKQNWDAMPTNEAITELKLDNVETITNLELLHDSPMCSKL